MTFKQFITRFERKRKATKAEWRVSPLMQAIRGPQNHCPISFVAGGSPCMVTRPAKKLGLTKYMAAQIASAADNHMGGARPAQVRRRAVLLKAAGL